MNGRFLEVFRFPQLRLLLFLLSDLDLSKLKSKEKTADSYAKKEMFSSFKVEMYLLAEEVASCLKSESEQVVVKKTCPHSYKRGLALKSAIRVAMDCNE